MALNLSDTAWPSYLDRPLASTKSSSSISTSASDTNRLNSSDDSNIYDIMDPLPPQKGENVSTVMTQVLSRMERVVEHLRHRGCIDAANNIAKNMISIIQTFSDTTAAWDIETSLMNPVAVNEFRKESSTAATRPKSSGSTMQGGSPCTWAAVAAVAPALDNSVVKSTTNITSQSDGLDNSQIESEVDEDRRVVWIRGWREGRPLRDVTQKVGQGPIYSMAYSSKDVSVCVIFQHTSSAKALFEDDILHIEKHGQSMFGKGCSTVMGLVFPQNDDLQRMNSPHNERRRLTFARQQLFANGMTEGKFKNDIYSIVGPKNVELVWLFNTGNATVVFSAVPLARMVRDEFIKNSRQYGSQYRDVHITYSHDPCERPISLIKQMPAGRDFREGTYGGDSALPAGVTTKSASTSRRTARDADGWQTIARRR